MSDTIAFKEEPWILSKLEERKVRVDDKLSNPEDKKLTIAIRDEFDNIKPILNEILLRSDSNLGYTTDEIDGYDVINIYEETIKTQPYMNHYKDVLNLNDEVIDLIDNLYKPEDMRDATKARVYVLSIILTAFRVDDIDKTDFKNISLKINMLSDDEIDQIISTSDKQLKSISEMIDG